METKGSNDHPDPHLQEVGEYGNGEDLQKTINCIMENNVVGIAVSDVGGVYKSFNLGAEQLTGYSRGEIVGKDPPPAIFLEEDTSAINKALALQGHVENMEVRLKRRDGGLREVSLSVSSCANGCEYIQFIIDNTEKKHLQSLLLHSQKMEVVGEMAGGIAHDFNNLLEGILGYTTFMMDMIESGNELRSYLEIVERSAKKASDLTERLLTFSRDEGKVSSLVNCNTLLREVVKLLERTIDRRIVIEVKLEKNLNAIRGAAGQIEQAFLNACLNARDAMSEGGKLYISSENVVLDKSYPPLSLNMGSGKYVRVSVTDTGVGMDKETQNRMFEPFFTTKKRGEGTGLGLNMVYGIVHNHGGFINVYSEIGKGTVFNIYIPAHDDRAPEDVVEREWQEVPAGKGEKILVIDDEPIVRDLSMEMLEKLGYKAIVAGDADDGMRKFKEQKDDIELVVLDIILPGASGHEVFKRMREIKSDTLVLLSSGYNRAFVGEEFINGSQIDFIQKPYSMEDLAREVRRILDRK